jgi:hypothetical protein
MKEKTMMRKIKTFGRNDGLKNYKEPKKLMDMWMATNHDECRFPTEPFPEGKQPEDWLAAYILHNLQAKEGN